MITLVLPVTEGPFVRPGFRGVRQLAALQIHSGDTLRPNYSVLILGASYGSLFATKLLLAGHPVTLVCTQPEVEIINRDGTLVYLPIRGREEPVKISSNSLKGVLSAVTPDIVNPAEFDLVVCAMQEPQYRSPGVCELMQRIAHARVPSLAIMNMPPLSYLERIPGLATDTLTQCYVSPEVWKDFEPELVTTASPDPQAFRPPDEALNVLRVGLPTNFKAARFETDEPTRMLRNLQADIEEIRFDPGDGNIELPVKLKVHDSIFVPLTKWQMLLAGNYRCIRRDDMISIKDAVHANIDTSRNIYEWVRKLCIRLGAIDDDLVPFDKYAHAAESLGKPSSAARALFSGAKDIERVDCLVQQIARQLGIDSEPVDHIVALVDERLHLNRTAP